MCFVHVSNGLPMILCGVRERKFPPCACGKPSTKQCDFPVGAGKTCDAYICDGCAVPIGENVDHCLGHSRVGKRYRVKSGKHEGHAMLLMAWHQVPKWPGAREKKWKYASQCSCLKAGDLAPELLYLLDLTTEVSV